ncbi:hypothetical protein QCB44_10360 [Thiomicrorhabdus sp. zzn3]|uniref:ATP-binding protein n=1 Tax=Thiomicrorhabdus sp. zzn3 TaxID=3039775 RepID=UPI0024369CE8|nr:ATP-binding protein [Thiomicrorhabdus sp. zzn3]MDG6779108.1 hypothetical protein [Thiomicrorhabdus sp. zzn3]
MDLFADWMALSFVTFGLSLLAVAYYVHRQATRLRKTVARLYELNQQLGRDALDFFEQAWPVLQQAGLLSLKADIDWFGEHRYQVFGKVFDVGSCQHFQIDRDDMHFKLTLCLPKYSGERLNWLELVVNTYIQILQQDIEHKHAEILVSQKRLERYQMFVQHEVKNIAQFIQLLSEQIAPLESAEDKLRLMERLQKTLPLMAERAANAVRQMKQPLSEFYASSAVELNELIEEVLFLYQLQAQVEGWGRVQIARNVLLEVFKNILGNYRDHPVGECPLAIQIEDRGSEGATVTIRSCLQTQNEALKPERMFEPFWTTSESGMGLGLFLTRELLKQVGSEIEFHQQGNQVSFELHLNNIPALK